MRSNKTSQVLFINLYQNAHLCAREKFREKFGDDPGDQCERYSGWGSGTSRRTGITERAAAAKWFYTAVTFALFDDLGMVLIKHRYICWQIIHEQCPGVLIACCPRQSPQALEQSPRIGIHHKTWFAAGVQ